MANKSRKREEDKKTERIQFLTTKQFKTDLDTMADAIGTPVAEIIRQAVEERFHQWQLARTHRAS